VCDIRIANRDAKYGANFARLGFHSGMAISYLLPRITGVPRAAELLFTGRVFTGSQAVEMGIANYAVAQGEVLAKARELAAEIAACAPAAVRMMKRSLYRGLNWDRGVQASTKRIASRARWRWPMRRRASRRCSKSGSRAFAGFDEQAWMAPRRTGRLALWLVEDVLLARRRYPRRSG
jgi:enoyl-CoA hydratase/carnithine racemase